MRKLLCCGLCVALLSLLGCQSSDPDQSATAPAVAPNAAPAAPPVRALIVTSVGEIEVEMYPDKTPRTTANFVALAKQGFYTNLIFHRVVNDFVIQGGGFNTEGRQVESPLGTIPLEIDPTLTHVDGALAMARTSDPNSAGAQFYICDGPQPNLNDAFLRQRGMPGYAVFGKVTKGMEVVRAIAATPTVNRGGAFTNLPDPLVVIKSVSIIE